MKKLIKNSKSFIMGLIVGLILTSAAFASSEYIQAKFTDFNLIINGKQQVLQTKPLVYNGTSYLPVREISNLLGYNVTYKSDTMTIILDSAKNISSLSVLSDEWITIRDFVEQYNIKVSVGETLIIESEKIIVTVKLDKIQNGHIYKLKDINNPNIEISFCQNNGKSFLFIPELKKLGIIS